MMLTERTQVMDEGGQGEDGALGEGLTYERNRVRRCRHDFSHQQHEDGQRQQHCDTCTDTTQTFTPSQALRLLFITVWSRVKLLHVRAGCSQLCEQLLSSGLQRTGEVEDERCSLWDGRMNPRTDHGDVNLCCAARSRQTESREAVLNQCWRFSWSYYIILYYIILYYIVIPFRPLNLKLIFLLTLLVGWLVCLISSKPGWRTGLGPEQNLLTSGVDPDNETVPGTLWVWTLFRAFNFSKNNSWIMMKIKRSGVLGLLESISEYKKGLLGLGGGMHSTDFFHWFYIIQTVETLFELLKYENLLLSDSRWVWTGRRKKFKLVILTSHFKRLWSITRG